MSEAAPTTVAGLLVQSGRVLLGLRAGWKAVFPLHWDAIAGRVEQGEALEAALARELSEEIGIAVRNYRLIETLVRQVPGGRKEHHVFAITNWVGEPANTSDENAEIRWFTASQLKRLPKMTPDLGRLARRALQPDNSRTE